jgi:hypothetical protein
MTRKTDNAVPYALEHFTAVYNYSIVAITTRILVNNIIVVIDNLASLLAD